MAQEKPLQTLYKSLQRDNYDVPDTYESFERTLTLPGREGMNNRHALYEALQANNYDVPDTYESFASTLFSPAPKNQTESTQAAQGNEGAEDAFRGYADLTSGVNRQQKKTEAPLPELDMNYKPTMNIPTAQQMKERAGFKFGAGVGGVKNPLMTTPTILTQPKLEKRSGELVFDNNGAHVEQTQNEDTGFEHYMDENGKHVGAKFVGQEGSFYKQKQEYDEAVGQQTERVKSELLKAAYDELHQLQAERAKLESELTDAVKGKRQDTMFEYNASESGAVMYDYQNRVKQVENRMREVNDEIRKITQYDRDLLKRNLEELDEKTGEYWKKDYEDKYNASHKEETLLERAKRVANMPTGRASGRLAIMGSRDEQLMRSVNHNIRETKRLIEAAESNADGKQNYFVGAASGFMNAVLNERNWDGGLMDLADYFQRKGIIDKYDKEETGGDKNKQGTGARAMSKLKNGEELTEAEDMFLRSILIREAAEEMFSGDLSSGYTEGQVAGQSLPFMLEMYINPLSASRKTATSTVGRGLRMLMGKDKAMRLAKDFAKLTYSGKGVLGRAAGSLARRSVMDADAVIRSTGMALTSGLPKVVGGTVKDMTGDIRHTYDENGNIQFAGTENEYGFWEALFKNTYEVAKENATEMGVGLVGSAYRGAKYALGKPFQMLGEKLSNTSMARYLRENLRYFTPTSFNHNLKHFLKQTQWHGTIPEYWEEVEGNVLDGIMSQLTNGRIGGDVNFKFDINDPNSIFNLDNNISTFRGVGLIGGFTAAVSTFGYRRASEEAARMISEADANGMEAFKSTEAWEQAKKDFANLSFDKKNENGVSETTEYIIGKMKDSEWTDEQKKAVFDYLHAQEFANGVAMGGQAINTEMDAAIADEVNNEVAASAQAEHTAEDVHENALSVEDATAELMKLPDGEKLKRMVDDMLEIGASTGEMSNILNGLNQEEVKAVSQYMDAMAQAKGVDLKVDDAIVNAVNAERERMTPFVVNEENGLLMPVTYNGRRGYIVGGNGEEVIVQFEDNGEKNPVLTTDEGLIQEPATTLEDYMAGYEQQVTAQLKGEVENARVNHPLTKLEPVVNDVIDTVDGKKRVAAVDESGIFLEEPLKVIDEQTGQMVPKHQKEFRPEDAVSLEEFVQKQNEYYDGMEQQEREKTRMRQQAENYEPVEAVDYEQEEKKDEMPVQGFDASEVKPVSENVAPADYEAAEGYEGGYDEGVTVDWREEQAKAERKKADDELVGRLMEKDEKASSKFIKNNLDKIEKDLKKARNKESDATDFDQFEKEMAQYDAEVQRLEAELERWNNISNRVRETRLATIKEAADDAIAQKKVEELGEPLTLREWIMRSLYNRGYKMVWGDDKKSATRGLASHLGVKGSQKETGDRMWMMDKREKGALYPEEVAEQMLRGYADDMGWTGTDGDWNVNSQDVLNELLDVVRSYGKRSDLGNAIVAEHEKASTESLRQQREEENYLKEEWAKSMGFTSFAEYDAYESAAENDLALLDDAAWDEMQQQIAEEYENISLSLQQNEQLNTQNNGQGINQAGGTGGSVVVSETGQAGSEGSAVGNEGQGSIQEAGSEGTGTVQEVQGEPGEEVEATGEPSGANKSSIQGLESYSEDEILGMVRDYFESAVADAGADADIVDMKIVGSRANGDADADSDLDVLVEYKGNAREDGLFNMLAEAYEPLVIDGIKVDINPITKGKSGTIAEWMKRNEGYKKEMEKKQEPLSETDPLKRAGQIVERGNLSALIPRRDIATDDVFKANHSEEEQERMRYVEGETFENYCKRNDLKPTDKDAQFYFFQKYADRWGDIEKALDGIDEDPRAVGFAVGQMVDSVAEGYEMLQLLKNIKPKSVLPFYDGVFDGYEEAHWDDEAKLQKAEANAKKPSKVEKQLRDYVVNLLRGMGIEVSTDAKEGQKVLDSVNEAKMSRGKKRALETVSVPQEEHLQTVVSSADGAKVLKNLETFAKKLENIANNPVKTFIGSLARELGATKHGSNSQYASFVTDNGVEVAFRIANHEAKVSNFDNHGEDEGISIVISNDKNSNGVENDGEAHLVEYFYNDIKLRKAYGKPLADIVRAVADALHTGKYVDPTGLAEREEVNQRDVKLHKVFHGSGADFDAFDHSFMGTGEGNQTFGWGTYVTEAEGVGRGYAKRTGDMKVSERRFIEGKLEEARKYNIPAQVEYWENELKEKNLENAQHYLYKVEIPEDDGSNYIDYFGKMQDQQGILDKIDNYMTSNEVYGFKWKRQNPDQRIQFRGGSRLITLTPNQSGADLYEEFKDAFGAKPASEILHAMGITGIKVPVNAMRGGNEKGEMNYVIFNENDAKITDKVRFFKTPDGNAYGFTVNGKIYIDPRIAGADTPIHEYAHLWCDMIRKTAPEEWEAIKKVILDDPAVSPIIERLKKEYPELTEEGREDDFVEEVITQFSGKRGAERLREVAEEVAKENGGKFTEEQVKTAFQRLKDILNKFWQSVAKMLGIKYRNANDVADKVMSDLLNGVKPESQKNRDKEYADAVAAGDMEKVDAMLREEAARKGYSENSDYQGSLAFNGAAPSKNGYYETKEERKEAFENGELEGEYSLGDFADNGVDGNDLGWQLDNPIPASGRDAATLESIRNLANTVKGKKRTIKMYRAVDADIKEDSFRNGDWVTPSRKYAEQHIGLQDWKKGRIIEQEVPIDDIWWNGDDINEWGYDDGKGYAYKNTPNNRKLMEPTYDKEGNLIPLSQRFNEERDDVLFRDADDIFISNAERAVEGIKQEKATPEQWLKMIEKVGGLKAGEDKWMGLSEWLKNSDAKTLTKQDVLGYIVENEISVEDVNYSSGADWETSPKMIELRDEFDQIAEEKKQEMEDLDILSAAFDEEMAEKYGYGWKDKLEGDDKKRDAEFEERWKNLGGDPYGAAFREMVNRHGDDFEQAFEADGGILNPVFDYYEDDLSEAARYYLDMDEEPINETRLSYTTEGLDNKKEIALVVPSIEPWNQSDQVHFGDAGGGRAVAWVRFGDTTIPVTEKVYKSADELQEPVENGRGNLLYYPKGMKPFWGKDYIVRFKDKDGNYKYSVIINDAGFGVFDSLEEAQDNMKFVYKNHPKEKVVGRQKVLVIDEIQSKRHQEGREKGYYENGSYEKSLEEFQAYNRRMREKYGEHSLPSQWSEEERKKFDRLRDENNRLYDEKRKGVPDAPFDKNWHELAMKRMLRYAAENGYDKVAWTKGEQQAERYSLGKVYNSVEREDNPSVNGKRFVFSGENVDNFIVDDNGIVIDATLNEAVGKSLGEVVGKDLAVKMMGMENGDMLDSDELRIGGEGMKGFYDQILPRFMNKYGKKWGVQVGEVELPNIGDQTYRLDSDGKMKKKGLTMWSVDVTPEMKESVMQGQPMFREGNGAVAPAPRVSKRRYTKEQIERANRKATEKFYDTVKKMGIADRVHVYENREDYLKSLDKKKPNDVEMQKARSKGWFDPKTKQIHIIVGNNRGLADTMKTLLHEGVAHYGLRELFGKNFDQFLDDVYTNAAFEIKEKIDEIAAKLKEREKSKRSDKEYRKVATEEYMAKVAEEMDFEHDSPSGWSATLKAWWLQIKRAFFDMMHRLGTGKFFGVTLTDNELRYILWRSWKNLTEPGAFRNVWNPEARAEDKVMQDKLKVGEYAEDYHGLINSKDVVAVNSKPTMFDGYTRGIGVEIDMTKGRHLNLFVNPMSGEVQVMSGTRGFTNGQRMRMEGEYLDNILGQRIANDIMENAVDSRVEELRKEDAKKADEMQQDVKKAEKFDIGKVVRMTAVAENDGFAPGVGVTMLMPDGRKLKLWVDTEDEKEDYYGDVDLYGDEWTDEEIERYNGKHIYEIVGSKLADEILRNGRNGFELDKKGINKLNGTMLQKAAEEKVEDLTTKSSDFMSDDMKTKVLDAYNMVHDKAPDAMAIVQTPYGYVMINKDAKVVRNLFNLEKNPYVVFPVDKLSDVLPVLIRAGHRVAVAETSNNKSAESGVVKESEDVLDAYDPVKRAQQIEEKKAKIEKAVSVFNDLRKRYNGKDFDAVVYEDLNDEELLDMLGVTGEMREGIKKDIDLVRNYFGNRKRKGFHNPFTGKITIFADRIKPEKLEETFFHENIHGVLEDMYGEELRDVAEHFWDVAPDEGLVSKSHVTNKENYESENMKEELFTFWLSRAMVQGKVDEVLDKLDDEDKEVVNKILNTIGYDRTKEEPTRRASEQEGIGLGKTAQENNRLQLGRRGSEEVEEPPLFRDDEDEEPTTVGKKIDRAYTPAMEEYEKAVMDTSMKSFVEMVKEKTVFRRIRNKFAEAYFDYSRSIKQLQNAIENSIGKKLKAYENVWIALNAKSSVDNIEIQQVMLRHIAPLSEHIGQMILGKKLDGKDITVDDVEIYMNAVHGIERNKHLAERRAKEKYEERVESLKKKLANEYLTDNERSAIEREIVYEEAKYDGIKNHIDNPVVKKWYERQLSALETMHNNGNVSDEDYEKGKNRWEFLYEKGEQESYRGLDYSGLTALFKEEGEAKVSVEELEARAEEYAKKFENAVGKDNVDKMWELADALNDWTLQKSYNSGLISKQQYEEIQKMYTHYVPLRGWHDDYAGDIYQYVTRGESAHVLQSVIKKSYGRTSRAGNILGTMAAMANSAIVQGNKNLVKQKFWALALEDGAKSGLMMVSDLWYEKNTNGEWVPVMPEGLRDDMSAEEMRQAIEAHEARMKELEEQDNAKVSRKTFSKNFPLNMAKWQEQTHAVRVLIGGKEKMVYVLGNPRAAMALNGMLNEDTKSDLGWVADVMTRLMRFEAKMQTSLSPEFMVSNFQRDVATAATGTYVKFGRKAAGQFAKNLSIIMPLGSTARKEDKLNGGGIFTLFKRYKDGTLDMSDDMQRYFEEFCENGGITGVSQIHSEKDYQKEMSKLSKRMGEGARGIPRKAWEALGDGVEFLNSGIENATRFAAYMTSRQMGKTIDESIFDAKEASVNFNMKGSGAWGNLWVRRYILYANPALQALRMLGTWYGANPRRFMTSAAITMAASFAMAWLNYLLSAGDGGDDDNDWWKLSEWNRYNYINLGWKGFGYLHYSIPQEYRPLWALGQVSFDLMQGQITKERALQSMVMQLNNLSPLAFFEGGTDLRDSWIRTIVKALTPTAVGTVMDAYAWNENFLGHKITNQGTWNGQAPEWQRTGDDTPEWAKQLGMNWNEMTGGRRNKKSWFDSEYLNPSAIYYILSQQFGGLGSMVTRTSNLIKQLRDPDFDKNEFDWRNVPFVPKFYVGVGTSASKNRVTNDKFWMYWNEFKDADYELSKDAKDVSNGAMTQEEADKTIEARKNDGSYQRWEKIESNGLNTLYENARKNDNKEMVQQVKQWIVDLLEKDAEPPIDKAFDETKDADVRKSLGKAIAKHEGVEDVYGKNPSETYEPETQESYYDYQRLRTADDVEEDSKLYRLWEDAKEYGYSKMADNIEHFREQVFSTKKRKLGHTNQESKKADIMKSLRKMRADKMKKISENYANELKEIEAKKQEK